LRIPVKIPIGSVGKLFRNGGMSEREKITPEILKSYKTRHKQIVALTAYDYPICKLLDESGVDLILVGDSLGMVVLGFPDTTHVTMGHMIHHTRAAARAKPKALLVADLPYQAYESAEQTIDNALALMEAGAEAVKIEGGHEISMQIAALQKERIPFIGHLGMLPQQVVAEGGYKIKGKTDEQARKLLDDAKFLNDSGAAAIVLELVTPPVSQLITESVRTPVIGIGAGANCDGQILVTHDLIGLFPWFRPKFAKAEAVVSEDIKDAVAKWRGTFDK